MAEKWWNRATTHRATDAVLQSGSCIDVTRERTPGMIACLPRRSRRPDFTDATILAHRRQVMVMLWPLLGVGAAVLVVGTPLIFAPRYPQAIAMPATALGGIAALGTAALALLLRHPAPEQQQRAWWLTELTGWTITVGCLVLFARYPDSKAPASLLFAAASAATGTELAGRLRGLLVCEGLLLGLAAAQRYLLGVSNGAAAQETFFSWTIAIIVVTVIARLVLRTRHAAHETTLAIIEPIGEPTQPHAESMATPADSVRPSADTLAAPNPLSPREREVLPYLATVYKPKVLGEVLNISWKTIKSHKEHIAEKLGTEDQERYTVVEAAKARGLLTDEDIRQAAEMVRLHLAAQQVPHPVADATPLADRTSRASEFPPSPARARRSA